MALIGSSDRIVPGDVLDQLFGDYLKGERYRERDLAAAALVDDDVRKLKAAHDEYRIGAKRIVDALRLTDPTKTVEGHHLDVEARANKWLEETSKRSDATRKCATKTCELLASDIEKSLALQEGPRSAEIRGFFLKMKSGNDRVVAAQKAIDGGDKETMTALLIAPSYLSGLDDKQQAALRRLHTEKQSPELLARKAIIEKALAINARAFEELLEGWGDMFPQAMLKEIAERKNVALAAREAIA